MTKKNRAVRAAVIGLGHWGPNIARNYHALGVLAGCYDVDPQRLQDICQRYPSTRPFTDLNELLEDDAIDAVAIATPAVTHSDLVQRALCAGKHVFVEKPLCLNLADAPKLKNLMKTQDRVLMVGHLLRYHGAYNALQAAIVNKVLGDVRYISSNRASLGKIRREENAFWSFAPHDVSMILGLMNGLPERVFASETGHLSPGVADTTLTHMWFPNGANAHIFVSWLHPYKDHRLIVTGSQAMAVFDDTLPCAKKLQLYRHIAKWQDDLPVVSKANAEPIPYDDTEPLLNECVAFLDAVEYRKHPPTDVDEGIAVLRVLDACQSSIRNRRPVELCENADMVSGGFDDSTETVKRPSKA